jgi:hypothetical protein
MAGPALVGEDGTDVLFEERVVGVGCNYGGGQENEAHEISLMSILAQAEA